MIEQPPTLAIDESDKPDQELRRRMRSQRIGVAAIVALIGGFCLLTYLVPPGSAGFLPRCQLHELTGLNCPGCGGTRAVYALLHGDVLQAAAYNLYFVLALPFLLWWGGYGLWATVMGKQFGPPRLRPWLWTFVWISLAAFTVLRNLPVSPFDWMAPHKL
jgi:hypothetical protein